MADQTGLTDYGVNEGKLQLQNRFTYHKPIADQPKRYELLRAKAKEFAELIARHTPESREQALALTNLEQACFWANAAIARNEKEL